MKTMCLSLSMLFTVLWFQSYAQPSKAITVIHCDPDDPSQNDNWPEKRISTQGWGMLNQMVKYASSKNVNLTIQLTPQWAYMILSDTAKIDSVKSWQNNGHELAAHHHLHLHTYWDGHSNIPSQTTGANGSVFIDTTEVFYNRLRVLCSPNQLLTAGVGPAGSPSDSIAIEWSSGIKFQTTNISGLDPSMRGGRFPDEAFSDIWMNNMYDPIRDTTFSVCALSYCFLEDSLVIDSIMFKANTSQYSVVGGVLHPYNYANSNKPFQQWIDTISQLYPGECKTVSQIIQNDQCSQSIDLIDESRFTQSSNLKIYPNPTSDRFFIQVNSKKYQNLEASIFSINGKKIKTFYKGLIPQGEYLMETTIRNYKAGNYFVIIKTPTDIQKLHFVIKHN